MLSHDLAGHFARVAMIAGACSALFAGVRGFIKTSPARSSPESVSAAVSACCGLLIASGWLGFLFLSAETRRPAAGLVAGIAAVAVSAKMGTRFEQRRLAADGRGTPVSSMMKRATVLFLGLTLVAIVLGITRSFNFRWVRLGVIGGFAWIWGPAALAWAHPSDAGTVAPGVSVARRGSLFALAVLGVASVACPEFLGDWAGARRIATGAWLGAGFCTLMVVMVSWLATRLSARASVLFAGLAVGAGGLCLRVAL